MTDLEKEIMRQIHELGNEIKTLRERIAVLELRTVPLIKFGSPDPYAPPFKITCGSHE